SDFEVPIGDAGKFYWVDRVDGFYFTCDDDLIYPEDYIYRIKSRILKSEYPVVIGWHGSVFYTPFKDYYDNKSRRVFSFSAPRPYDTPVHVLGTGCLGFHTSHIKVSFSDFPTPNMADVYFAKLGQEQEIPFVVIKHMKSEIIEASDSQEFSIYQHSSNDVKESKHNTKLIQNEIVSSLKWHLHFIKKYLKILIIGRFNINAKGGVFKSSNLLVENLKKLGHSVDFCCLSEINEFNFSKTNFDFSIIYAPDPDRPDFSDCLDKVKMLADNKCVCAVNFSFNLDLDRSEWIKNQLLKLNVAYDSPRIYCASFSNSTQLKFDKKYSKYIINLPKTISIEQPTNHAYDNREGIFLGDLAKLGNEKLVHGHVVKWIEKIRINLPHVNIYALKHYHTDIKLLDYIKILPYDKNINNMLSKFRICVCLTPGATFEMIPVESLICGTPVIHRNMPQSLSEYLSPISVEVSTPVELGEMCKQIYESEDIWNRLNVAGYSSNEFFDVKNVSALIDLSIRKALSRSQIGK
ncbi:MAG: hypothetical protein ACKVJE_19780, partial [Pseudomonadales bacterium]